MAADAFKNDPDQYDPDLSDPQLTGSDPYDSGQLDPDQYDPSQIDPAQFDPDMPDPSAGLPPDLDTAAPFHGNRPATGAHHASPGDILSQGFDGDQSAGDFLGLDVEFTASQGHMDPSGLDLVTPPTTGDAYVPVPAPLPDGDAAQEFAEAPSAFEFGEDLGSEDGEAGEFAFQDEGGPGHGRGLMAGALVAILVGAGVFFGPRFLGSQGDQGSQLAKAPAPSVRPTPQPTAGTEPAPADPVAPAAGTEVASGAPKTADPVVETPPVTAKGPAARTSDPVDPVDPADTAFTRVTPPSTGERTSGPVVDPASSATSANRARTEVVQSGAAQFPDLSGSAYEWASEDRLELIWRGEEVPLDAVRAPAKTIMPRVGRVRVLMDTGDVFDGRLYAVGQNRVWIESEPGRIGLDGERVVKIELMPEVVEGTAVPAEEMGVGGKRVRVRVAGGTLFGRVIKAEGNEVIMKLDSGGRVRVEADEVEELGTGRAVVVRR